MDEKKITKLTTTIDFLQRGLIICSYDVGETLRDYSKEISHRLSRQYNIETKLIRYSNLDCNKISQLLKENQNTGNKIVIMITFTKSLMDEESIKRINLIRDLFAKSDFIIVWWATNSTVTKFEIFLPDLWRIKAKLFEFKHDKLIPNSNQQYSDDSFYYEKLKNVLNQGNRQLIRPLAYKGDLEQVLKMQEKLEFLFSKDLFSQNEDDLFLLGEELINMNEVDTVMNLMYLLEQKFFKTPSSSPLNKNKKLAEIAKKFADKFQEKHYSQEARDCYAMYLRYHPKLNDIQEKDTIKIINMLDIELGTPKLF